MRQSTKLFSRTFRRKWGKLSSFLQTKAWIAVMLLGLHSAWFNITVGICRNNFALLWEGMLGGSKVLALCVQDYSIYQPMEYIPHGGTDLVKFNMMWAQWFPQIHLFFLLYRPSHLYTQWFLYNMILPLRTTSVEGKKTKPAPPPPPAAPYVRQPV